MYIYIQMYVYDEREGKLWVFIPETTYLIAGFCYFKAFGYLLSFIFLFYNSLNLFVELYGVFNNMTRQEIMCRQRYQYLFEIDYKKSGQP